MESKEMVDRFARLMPFKLSREQLIRYQHHHNRPIPTKFDKETQTHKGTMDKKAIDKLVVKYPEDSLYSAVLEHRVLDKIAGTYIGRPMESE